MSKQVFKRASDIVIRYGTVDKVFAGYRSQLFTLHEHHAKWVVSVHGVKLADTPYIENAKRMAQAFADVAGIDWTKSAGELQAFIKHRDNKGISDACAEIRGNYRWMGRQHGTSGVRL